MKILKGKCQTKKVFIIAILLMLMMATVLRADIIYLKSGNKIEGKISSETETQLGVQTNNKSFYVMRTDIIKVEKIKEKQTDYGVMITSGLVVGLLLLGMYFLVGSSKK